MKKFICALSTACILLSMSMPISVAAKDVTATSGDTELTVEVPANLDVKITISGNGNVLVNGEEGVVNIERQSSAVIAPVCEEGNVLECLIVNGVDVTSQMIDGTYTLDRVHDDIIVEVTFKEDENYSSSSGSSSGSSSASGTDSKASASSAAATTASQTQNTASTSSPNTGIALGISAGTVLCAAATFVIVGRKKEDDED